VVLRATVERQLAYLVLLCPGVGNDDGTAIRTASSALLNPITPHPHTLFLTERRDEIDGLSMFEKASIKRRIRRNEAPPAYLGYSGPEIGSSSSVPTPFPRRRKETAPARSSSPSTVVGPLCVDSCVDGEDDDGDDAGEKSEEGVENRRGHATEIGKDCLEVVGVKEKLLRDGQSTGCTREGAKIGLVLSKNNSVRGATAVRTHG